MSGFSLSADFIVEAIAALATIVFVLLALRAGVSRQAPSAILWLALAVLACAVLIFFLTFQIRLM